MQKGSLTFIPGLMLCLLPTPLCRAGSLTPDLQQRLQAVSDDTEIPVIVRFSDPIRSVAAAQGDRAARRATMIRALRARAEESQRPMREFLQGKGVPEPTMLWLINAMAFKARRQILQEIARWPEVERMDLDGTIREPEAPAGRTRDVVVGNSLSTLVEPEWNIGLINAPGLWALGHSGTGLVIGSMDSGADAAHQDLQGTWRGGTNSWLDPNGQHSAPYDNSGHGTGTLGLMVGGGAGGSVIGVAPAARWIAVKIFDDSGVATDSGIHQGFQWLLDPDGNPTTDDGADVVNNSWGYEEQSGLCIDEFEADIAALRAAGIAVVSSAGNGGPMSSSSVSPANYPQGLAIGAVDIIPGLADFSGRGPAACDGSPYPEAVAPGVDVRTADLTFGGAIPGNYAYVTGTSFSAPHVAGGVALLAQAFPAATVEQVEASLLATARDMGDPGPDNDSGYGLVDLLAAHDWLASGSGCSDGDADGRSPDGGICGSPDCDDETAEVWGVPGEVQALNLQDTMNLSWTEPLQPGGAAGAVRYDTLRSGNPSDFDDGAACVETDDAGDTVAVDAEVPLTGAAFYYLVRAENTCPAGQGSLGMGSGGAERIGRTCEL